jgi:hypothetical protein
MPFPSTSPPRESHDGQRQARGPASGPPPSTPRRDRRFLPPAARRREPPALLLPAPLRRHPPGQLRPVDPSRLAALAGREPGAILRAFPELAPAAPRPAARRYPREEVERNRAARREKYAAIRRDAENGLGRRAIISTRHVGRRTIALALASAEPPERKKIHRESAALNGLHAIIDAMIDVDPAIGTAAIWQRLADDHGATVAYYTLRTYVVSRRQRPGSTGHPIAINVRRNRDFPASLGR